MRAYRASLLAIAFTLAMIPWGAANGAEGKPLTREQIEALLNGGVAEKRIIAILGERSIGFDPMEADLQVLKSAKASDELLAAVRAARRILPPEVQLARHKARAAEFESRGAAADAEMEYRAAIALDLKDADLQAGLARSLARQKKWDAAVAAYRQTQTLKPNDFETTYQLGVAFEYAGNQTDAINTWAEAARIKPDDPKPYEQLARAFTERKDWRRAAIAYKGLVKIQPNSAPARVGLGNALRNDGNMNGAIEAFREAVRLSPNDPVVHNNLGFALEEKGDIAAALVQYRAALDLSPQDQAIKANFERATQRARKPSLKK